MTAAPGLLRRIRFRLRHPVADGIVHGGVVFRQDGFATALLAAPFMLSGATYPLWFPRWPWQGVGAAAGCMLVASVLFIYPEHEAWRFTPQRRAALLIPLTLIVALVAAWVRTMR